MQSFFSNLPLDRLAFSLGMLVLMLSAFSLFRFVYHRPAYANDDRTINALRTDVALAIAKAEVSLDQLADIASTHDLGLNDVYGALQYCLREALTGRQDELAQKSDSISKLLSEFREQIFGTAIPDDTAILLNEVKRELGQSAKTLEPLVENIRRLVAENARISAIEKKKSTWSLAFGVVGVVLGLFLWRFPYSPDASTLRKEMSDVEKAVLSPETGMVSCTEKSCVLRYKNSLGGSMFISVPFVDKNSSSK